MRETSNISVSKFGLFDMIMSNSIHLSASGMFSLVHDLGLFHNMTNSITISMDGQGIQH